MVEASYALPVATVLLAGGYFLNRGMVTLGAVVAAALYLQQAIEPLDRLLIWVEQAQRGFASLARVLGVGQVAPEPRGNAPRPPTGRELVVRGARFSYSDGHDVLHGIDLEVRPGERLAIVGPSGAGKSTLARLLAGIDPPRSGVVSIGGCPVTDLDPAQRRRRIALITQEHHVFIGSLRRQPQIRRAGRHRRPATVRFGHRGRGVGAELPDGLDTQLGEGAPRARRRARPNSSRWPGWCWPTRTP